MGHIFLCLQSAERRKAVLSSLVKYLGPEAASFIHYEEKVSAPPQFVSFGSEILREFLLIK